MSATAKNPNNLTYCKNQLSPLKLKLRCTTEPDKITVWAPGNVTIDFYPGKSQGGGSFKVREFAYSGTGVHHLFSYLKATIEREQAASGNGLFYKSEEWCVKHGVVVTDPDGWDRLNFDASWNESITEAEFKNRLAKSTTMTMPAQKVTVHAKVAAQ